MSIEVVDVDLKKKRMGLIRIVYGFAGGRHPPLTPSIKHGIEDYLMVEYDLDPNEWHVRKHYTVPDMYYWDEPVNVVEFVKI